MLQTSLFNKATSLIVMTVLAVLFTVRLYAQQVELNPTSLSFSTTQNHASIVHRFSFTVSGVAANTPNIYKNTSFI